MDRYLKFDTSSPLYRHYLDLRETNYYRYSLDLEALASQPVKRYVQEIYPSAELLLEILRINILYRSKYLTSGIVSLFDSGNLLCIPNLGRAFMEVAAITYTLENEFNKFLENEIDEKTFDDFIFNQYMGNRYLTERYLDEITIPSIIEPKWFSINSILSFIDKLDKKDPGVRFREGYDTLSEFCHPNYGASMHFLKELHKIHYGDLINPKELEVPSELFLRFACVSKNQVISSLSNIIDKIQQKVELHQ